MNFGFPTSAACFLQTQANTHLHCTGCVYDEGLSLFAHKERLVELYEAEGCRGKGTREWVGLMSSQHDSTELAESGDFDIRRLTYDEKVSYEIVIDATTCRPFRSTLTILKGGVDVYHKGDVTITPKPFAQTAHGRRADQLFSSVVYESCYQNEPSGIANMTHLLNKRRTSTRDAMAWLSHPKETTSTKENFMHRMAQSPVSPALWRRVSELFRTRCGNDRAKTNRLINEWLGRPDACGETPLTVAVLAANADLVELMLSCRPPLTHLETKDGEIKPRYLIGRSTEYEVVKDAKESEESRRRRIHRLLDKEIGERARLRQEVASQLLNDEAAAPSRKKIRAGRGNRSDARTSVESDRQAPLPAESTPSPERTAEQGETITPSDQTTVDSETPHRRTTLPTGPPSMSFADAVTSRNRVVEERDQMQRTPIPVTKAPASTETEDNLCVICCNEPQAVAIVPCGHVCFCLECADQQRVSACPICRVDVTSFLRLYRV